MLGLDKVRIQQYRRFLSNRMIMTTYQMISIKQFLLKRIFGIRCYSFITFTLGWKGLFSIRCYSFSTFVPLGCMFWQQGTGLLFRRNVMNTLPLIRSKLKRAELLHSAQLIATSHGDTYHDQSALNANSACRKEKFKRLHDAQLISF